MSIIRVPAGATVTITGTCLCKKCGARFQAEEMIVGQVISNEFVPVVDGKMRQCPNPDCSHILIDFTDGVSMDGIMCDSIEISG